MQAVGLKHKVVTFTPVISAALYAAGQQLGGINKIADATEGGGCSALLSLMINDAAKQKSAIDLLFFSTSPTVASVNGQALSITAAQMAANFVGRVVVPAVNYGANNTTNGADAYLNNINMLFNTQKDHALFCILQCQGTPTYATSGDLTVRLGFQLD